MENKVSGRRRDRDFKVSGLQFAVGRKSFIQGRGLE
jgi:hypothetical protein